jgi:hypothetical protein
VTTKPLWRPTIAQLCTIAELSHARVPVEAIAKAVKLTPRAFRAWQDRLKTAAAVEASKPIAVALVVPEAPVNRGAKPDIERRIAAYFK